jgi:DNA replication protein DnaC
MIAADTDLDALFKRLHLANARRVWRGLIDQAERERWSYRDFLTLLATEEIAHRQQTRLARLTRRAHFPFLKTIDDFNSPINRRCASRCSAPRCRPISSPRVGR